MSAGEPVAEDRLGSGAWDGVRAAMRGGASMPCPESCTLSAGGCTDSHTNTRNLKLFMHMTSKFMRTKQSNKSLLNTA